jgi:hypothetical protein
MNLLKSLPQVGVMPPGGNGAPVFPAMPEIDKLAQMLSMMNQENTGGNAGGPGAAMPNLGMGKKCMPNMAGMSG